MLEVADVFIYAGHGAGEAYLPRRALARLSSKKADGGRLPDRGNDRCASAILMGCSSGALGSRGPHFDPSGCVGAYLTAGAPAVLANLWDVTDRDIDKFSLHLLRAWFGEVPGAAELNPQCLAALIPEARQVCKLKYLIGCAPVCYGIPVYLQHHTP